MTDTNKIVVATLNTYFGRSVLEKGLKFLGSVDILLLQELYSPNEDNVQNKLKQQGFELISVGGHFGLAIALRIGSTVKFVKGSMHEAIFQNVNKYNVKSTSRYAGKKLELSDRGLLSAKFKLTNGTEFVAASTHAPVVTATRQRADFLSKLTMELKDPIYNGILILAGDMNHYPGPKSIDYKFRSDSRLTTVDLGVKYTWPSGDAGFLESKIGKFYGGQFDDILYRGKGVKALQVDIADAMSDHRAVIAEFLIKA